MLQRPRSEWRQGVGCPGGLHGDYPSSCTALLQALKNEGCPRWSKAPKAHDPPMVFSGVGRVTQARLDLFQGFPYRHEDEEKQQGQTVGFQGGCLAQVVATIGVVRELPDWSLTPGKSGRQPNRE